MKPLWNAPRGAEGSVPSGVDLFAGDFAPPLLIAKDSALDSNANLMAAYCDRHGLSLAPHAKTSMAPELLLRQLEAGAWGLTVATAAQAGVLRRMGMKTILIANELVDPASIGWALTELEADPALRLLSLVDSVEGVNLLADMCAGARRGLEVLIELGVLNGRSGCRTLDDALELANAVQARPELSLAGVECYEGVIAEPTPAATLQRVDALLDDLRSLATRLDEREAFSAPEIIVSAGGSAYFDRVAARLGGGWELSRPVRVVVRSGAYIAHDSGFYAGVSPFDGRGAGREGHLIPALEIWGAVLSRPEPNLAIVGFGKRDAPYDLGLPIPTKLRRRRNGTIVPLDRGSVAVAALNDEHAYLRGECGPLSVGDWVGCGISHPCTAFDKWSRLILVNDDYCVVGQLDTAF